jgi:hypothetical protein
MAVKTGWVVRKPTRKVASAGVWAGYNFFPPSFGIAMVDGWVVLGWIKGIVGSQHVLIIYGFGAANSVQPARPLFTPAKWWIDSWGCSLFGRWLFYGVWVATSARRQCGSIAAAASNGCGIAIETVIGFQHGWCSAFHVSDFVCLSVCLSLCLCWCNGKYSAAEKVVTIRSDSQFTISGRLRHVSFCGDGHIVALEKRYLYFTIVFPWWSVLKG